MLIKESIIKNYLTILLSKGEDGFYKYLVGIAILQSVTNKNYEDHLLDLSDGFFSLYRKDDKEEYFVIGKILRRAAHTTYRQLLKLNSKKKINKRFLQAV
jgi:hypothetical protein